MELEFSPEALVIVGAVDPAQIISAATITTVIAGQEQTLTHGQQFTGRPVTKIIADDQYVIKWRSEYRFSEKDTRRWIEQTLARERQYQVHPPAKTWFYLRQGDHALIANITPRLLPLHMAHATLGAEPLLVHLEQLAGLYLHLAATQQARLDEGLSNFGVDAAGKLFYLDDDVYAWDKFTTLTQMLGVWLRQLVWLTPAQAQRLGEAFRLALLQAFNDAHWLTVISRQLSSLFFNPEQLARKQAFLAGFAKVVPASGPKIRQRRLEQDVFAVLADVHGNYPALRAVLAQLDDWGIRDGIVLGDVVGYGPQPQACIDALRERDFLVLKGNHDHGFVTGNLVRGFSTYGRWVLEWTRDHINAEGRAWLEALPAYHQQDDWLAVHGAPQDQTFFNAYVYQMTYESNLDYMAEHKIPLCLHGHTHVQGTYYLRGRRKGFEHGKALALASVSHGLICPGSIGQPRSRRVGAEFAVFDRRQGEVRFYLLDYPLEETLAEMRRQQFPEPLLTRLQAGQ